MGFMTYDFDIPGEPVAKGRPRFYGYRAVTPQHTRDAEELVRNQFHMFYPHAEPLDGDVMMILMFYNASIRLNCRLVTLIPNIRSSYKPMACSMLT